MNKTIIAALAIIGVILVSGCVQQAANNTTNTSSLNQEVSSNQVASEVSQQLIDENQTTVKIGDMV